MKKTISLLKNILYFLILFLTGVLAAEWICSRIVVNKSQPNGTIAVYLLSNGVHTDLVLPVQSNLSSWDTLFERRHTSAADSTLDYIGIGWGDKGFYLETPTWADLKASTALKAMTGLSSSALHCTYMKAPLENDKCVKVWISEAQYKTIIQEVLHTYLTNEQGKPKWIPTNAVYGKNDAFYDAKGSYYIFKTCNTWTNGVLKSADMKAATWLLFSKPLMNIYK